ncbi:hypothetical protein [Flavobacterium piscisymbiosum]
MFPVHVNDEVNESHKSENIKNQASSHTNSLKDDKNVQALLNSESISQEDKKAIENVLSHPKTSDDSLINLGYKSVNQIDSIQKYGPESKKLSAFGYWINRKIQIIKDQNTGREALDKFIESFIHNLPKVLFIIMPFFAFFLWIFHNKKRWYYFDHGIFTLHYFSFLLLIFLILFSVDKIATLLNYGFINFISGCITFIGVIWAFYYFFPAHHRFYGESRILSFTKSIVLFFINSFFILLLLLAFAFYTFINLH